MAGAGGADGTEGGSVVRLSCLMDRSAHISPGQVTPLKWISRSSVSRVPLDPFPCPRARLARHGRPEYRADPGHHGNCGRPSGSASDGHEVDVMAITDSDRICWAIAPRDLLRTPNLCALRSDCSRPRRRADVPDLALLISDHQVGQAAADRSLFSEQS